MSDTTSPAAKPPRSSLLTDPRTRSILIQGTVLVLVCIALWFFISNGRANLAARNIQTGFGFLDQQAGFDISQTLIAYNDNASYGRVFMLGLLNTLLVAAIGIVLATIIGFTVGIARLSQNWLVSKLAEVYVEVIRNLPLLFQILFWYLGVLAAMPAARQSLSFFGFAYFNNRGVVLARPLFNEGSGIVGLALLAGIVLAWIVRRWAHRRQMRTGQPFPTIKTMLALIFGLPIVAFIATGFPISLEWPVLRGFNFAGGIRIIPEFVALLLALSTYTGGFIAEIVRAGIQSVNRGQAEAAGSLGLRPGPTRRLKKNRIEKAH